jgi:hypothetical protein
METSVIRRNGARWSFGSGLFVAVALVSGNADAQDPAGREPVDPVAPGDITEFTRGLAYGIAESSWIHQPQIESLHQVPAPRTIPITMLPIDPAVRRGFKPKPRAFTAFDGIGHTGWVPPDCTLAVGPNHIVQTVNMQVAWTDKLGNLQFSVPLNDSGNPGFFEGVGAQGFTFDPKCFYDDIDGRFVVLALEVYGSTESWIDIAVSDDSDPNGTWYKYRTDSVTWNGSTSYWVDYPGFGYDKRAYYVTGNLFGLNASGWGGAKYRIFDKAPLLTGAAATWADLQDTAAASVQVAECHKNPRNPLFVSLDTNTSIKIQAIRNILTSPSLTTTTVTVPYFQAPPGAPELGGGTLDTLDGRLINAEFRGTYHLYTAHGIALSGGTRALARWYDFQTNNWPEPGMSVVLTQSGEVDLGPNVHTWYPGISRNVGGEVGIVMAYSSAAEYAGIAVAVHRTTDPNGVVGLMQRVKGGATSASGRWGDYFDCCTDPSDVTKFWGVGEYPNWGTWITDFDGVPDSPTSGVLYSTRATTTIGSLTFEAGDIVHLDPVTNLTAMYFDCSDVISGAANVDAFCLRSDGTILMSFEDTLSIPGLTGGPNGTTVEDEDVVKFTPTSLGDTTSGSFSFYFDGSDVALNVQGEDIDALAVDNSGNLLVSFLGPWDVGGGLTGQDEDVLKFTATSLGATTAGTWSWFLNSGDPDVALDGLGEDLDALDFDLVSGTITLSTEGSFQVPVGLTGQNHDLLMFTPTALGFNPAGSYQVTLDGDLYGLTSSNIDGLEILP